MNNNIGNKLNLLIKSEKALLKLEAAKRSRQIIIAAVGVIAVFAALVMLNLSAYYYLETQMSPQLASLTLAGFNTLLALIFFWVSSKQTTGAQTESIQEVRDFALMQLAEDVEGIKNSALEVKSGIQRVSSSMHGVMNRDYFSLSGLLPLLQMLLDARKQKRKKE